MRTHVIIMNSNNKLLLILSGKPKQNSTIYGTKQYAFDNRFVALVILLLKLYIHK